MGIGKYVSPSAWKDRISRYKRTIKVARKPDKEEFTSSVKISGSGLVLIGTLGFAIFLIYQLVTGFL
jgi:protein transport protein SEC61 subunit gamma and related proteins